jgi:hypothetical protein
VKTAWTFKSRFRSKAYGWKGSSLAIKLKEAVSEIKKVARTDAVAASDGAVSLFERFWPELERLDSAQLPRSIHTVTQPGFCWTSPNSPETPGVTSLPRKTLASTTSR